MSNLKKETIWSGNTFPARDAIKALGGVWDATKKVWIVPALGMKERGTASNILYRTKGIIVTSK